MPFALCCDAALSKEEFVADNATAAKIAAPTAKLPMEYLSTVRTLCIVWRVPEQTLQLAVWEWKRSSRASLSSLGPAAYRHVKHSLSPVPLF